MEDKLFIQKIRLSNLLSFAPETKEVNLRALNILIGTNGSGKSNFIEALSLLKSAPDDIRNAIRQGGGVFDYIYKGSTSPKAEIEVHFTYPSHHFPIRYKLSFINEKERFLIDDEVIEDSDKFDRYKDDVYFYYRWQNGTPSISLLKEEKKAQPRKYLVKAETTNETSVFSQIKSESFCPEITYLGKMLASIKIFNDWYTGVNSSLRKPQKTDLQNDFLNEDLSNLALILNKLESLGLKNEVLNKLKMFNNNIVDYFININFSMLTVYIREMSNDKLLEIPSTRLSDGTLRLLCLCCILLHPKPPPLICIEEPEVGLHPDALHFLAELLIEASTRTQIIITTHSDILVSRLGSLNKVDSVVVCENDGFGTKLNRLKEVDLSDWLRDYKTLGDVWLNGNIGGTL